MNTQVLRIGPRLLKTGLAVSAAVFLARMTGLYEVYVALAAAFGVAPTANHSFKTATTQIGVNLVAGLIGGVGVLLFGPHPIVIGATLVAALALCQLAGLQGFRDGVLSATLFVMGPHPGEHIEKYIFVRWLSIAAGCIIGVTVNALILPPDYRPKTVAALKKAGAQLDAFLLSVTNRLHEPSSYSKAEILAAAAAVEQEIAEARRLQQLAATEWRDTSNKADIPVLERAVKVLSSLLDRTLVVHKAALVASTAPGYADRLVEFQVAMRRLVELRQAVYAQLEETPGRPDVLAELEQMEGHFEEPPALPSGECDLPTYFQRQQMRSSFAEMPNRVAHLYLAVNGIAS